MDGDFTPAQQLKFALLDEGLALHGSAWTALRELNGTRSLSPHDYASTSGVILELDDDVWVNAPIEAFNPNFVTQSPYQLLYDNGFRVEGQGLVSRATFWPQPAYHSTTGPWGPWNNFVVTHGDRGRLSPLRSCAMTCTFCNIPYDDAIDVYSLKPVDALLAAAHLAIDDPIQPARHLLISGGTPKPKDIGWMREFYERMLTEFPNIELDIMMVPLPGLFDLPRLAALGLHELSINIELFNRDLTREFARQKYNQGLALYLDFIEAATTELGVGRARSMLMVGLEPVEDTLAGVRAIAERGGTPVLSPFRPDPATPLRQLKPPSAETMIDTYLRARDITEEHGVALGPDCPPCSHNTLNFATDSAGALHYQRDRPRMLGAC
ncbi:radical SAM protein [Mycolicibacterium vanbaalenii]|uniref:Radical SAM domain protein n=1 Tax=Mycolicibacterium vanbaalenii (strain DSM 7251 / JCM 13017 / BCRC 16820 / KCTC 9966 / NRRL B-24157 / PYR-1) TaxID=350058 RepID=A1THV5_MYCVP|nr:radical SAM protein [Mycolicibacterium vanbaalenii]ABM16755.1 Radical SAM domain protein [Mycolicibacterium vanbaalenii PYR-1]MCV7126967.1 radical SAM protein [Mycolicibacterium vanbaalenii PYR-1]